MKTPPPLSRDSAEWITTKRWLVSRIYEAQRELEKVGLGERESDAIRGKIAGWREFMLDVEPQRMIEPEKLEHGALDSTVDY